MQLSGELVSALPSTKEWAGRQRRLLSTGSVTCFASQRPTPKGPAPSAGAILKAISPALMTQFLLPTSPCYFPASPSQETLLYSDTRTWWISGDSRRKQRGQSSTTVPHQRLSSHCLHQHHSHSGEFTIR